MARRDNKEIEAQLRQAMANGSIVRLCREGLEDGWAEGYVAAMGPDFFAIELIDGSIRLDGYNCFRYIDISECEAPAPNAAFAGKALKARGLARSGRSDMDVSSLPALFQWASERFPLVTIHQENFDEGVCFIGKVASVTDHVIRLLEVTPEAEWEATPNSYDLDSITRVDFGGGYEEALFLVARSS